MNFIVPDVAVSDLMVEGVFMFGGPEGLVILVLMLVLFGGSQLPKLAKNLGEAQRELRKGMESPDAPPTASAAPAAAALPAPELPEAPAPNP